jgi:N6-L-threonylcarbamoyladenine synthase
MTGEIKILAFETSCDETAVAIVRNGRQLLSNLVASQIQVHQRFGGVVPEVASRKHIEVIAALTDEAFRQAGLNFSDIDAVAVTNTPGLIGALLVGVSFAKAFAYGLARPLVAVTHLQAHIYANFLKEENPPQFPAVCLVVSGGHTSILFMKDHRSFEVMGETRDDAAGEAFDKVARFLGLGYPGGPVIQKAAEEGRPGLYKLPRVFLDKNDFEFSFSGLKTATMNLWNRLQKEGTEARVADLAAEFQQALVEVLVEKTIHAAQVKGVENILVAGGVAANALLRLEMEAASRRNHFHLHIPRPVLCTDNAAMVGCAGYYRFVEGRFAGLDLNAYPHSGFMC